MRVYVHSGALSADNGAVAPVTTYCDFAGAVNGYSVHGFHYCDDALDVPDENWPVTEQLLIESKMLYRPAPTPGKPLGPWLNVQTDKVRQALGLLDPEVS
jgi:hypothetical protein